MDKFVKGLGAVATGNVATEQTKEGAKQSGTGGNIATLGVTRSEQYVTLFDHHAYQPSADSGNRSTFQPPYL